MCIYDFVYMKVLKATYFVRIYMSFIIHLLLFSFQKSFIQKGGVKHINSKNIFNMGVKIKKKNFLEKHMLIEVN